MSKPKAKSARASKRKVDRIMVVYGFDENKKPKVAKFSEPEFKLARKAADLMKLGCPTKHSSPQNSSGPKTAMTASFPWSEITLSLILPFLM